MEAQGPGVQDTSRSPEKMERIDGPGEVIGALKLLCSPSNDVPVHKTEKGESPSKREAFNAQLTANLEKFHAHLKDKPALKDLHHQYEAELTKKFNIPPSKGTDVQWQFVLSCIISLKMINHVIQESMQVYNEEEEKHRANLTSKEAAKVTSETSAPRMSPDTLSFEQQKIISSSLQFTVCLGIMPNVSPGVGLPVECRSGFADVVEKTVGTRTDENDLRLIACIKCFLECVPQPALGGIILSKYLGDLLAALCQIVFEPKRKPQPRTNIRPDGDIQGKVLEPLSTDGHSTDHTKASPAGTDGLARDKVPVVNASGIKQEVIHTRKGDFLKSHAISSCPMEKSQLQDANTKTESVNVSGIKQEVIHTRKGDFLKSHHISSPPLEEQQMQDTTLETKYVSVKEKYRTYCSEQLTLLLSRVYQPMLVRELLMLQGAPDPRMMASVVKEQKSPVGLVPAPAWLRKACGRLLSDILIKPQGVQHILRGMLQGTEDVAGGGLGSGASDWRKCDAVARIIAHCPRGVSVEEYYKNISPQVLDLLHIKDKTLARHFLRVTLSTMVAMDTQHREATEEYVISPLLQPLIICLSDKDIRMSDEPKILVEEDKLNQCIEDIHKVLVSGSDPQAASVLVPHLRPLLHIIFSLFCFTLHGVINLRSTCHEILAGFFDRADHQAALRLLLNLAFNDFPSGGATATAMSMHPSAVLAPGGAGGAVIISRPLSGEAPSQPIEDFEIRSEALVQVLKKLQNHNITADFFLCLLDDLTKLIATRIENDRATDSLANQAKIEKEKEEREKKAPEEEEERPKKEDEGKVLLEMERRQIEEEKSFRRSLVVLHLLASLAEDIGPACLKSPDHILSFVQITLERGLQVLKATDDEMMGVFESETVTMAMGMLTAMMGGAAELSKEDKDNMKVLLPLLEEFSKSHPDPEVQEMAKDLRIAIATRGMVWSDLLRAAEAKERSAEEVKVKADAAKVKLEVEEESVGETASGTDRGKGKVGRPLIEVISSDDFPDDAGKSDAAVTSQGVNIKSEPLNPGADVTEGHAHKLLEGLKGKPGGSGKEKTRFQQAIDELCDPLVPVRGHGLISLRKLIQEKDPETLEQDQLLCKVFRENLDHDDTYIYLSSVEGLAALADRLHETVVPALVAEFANFDLQAQKEQTKVKKVQRSPELRVKIGEVLVKTSRSLGDIAPKYRDVMLGAMLTGARDPEAMVRASSMSNLGEISKNLRFSLGNVIHEVLACVSALLKSDPEPEVRKAAALFTTLLLQGLGQDVTKVMDTSLRDFYRLLRHVETVEKDEMVRVHILLALEELDSSMRGVLFRPQSLTKRIRVLDPE